MKKVISVVWITVLFALMLLVGCGGVLTGSGNLKTEDYTFSDFTSVEISSAFEFEITQSDSYGVSITADDNVIEKVQVIKEGDTLKIGLKSIPALGALTLKAAVSMPQLHELLVSGASRGTIKDFSSTENFNLNVSGASKVTGDITAGDVDCEVSGASTVQLEGSANEMVADVSGASRINLGGFAVSNASIIISGAGMGMVNVGGKLDANLSGASKLQYVGEPTMGNINTSGASSLSKK